MYGDGLPQGDNATVPLCVMTTRDWRNVLLFIAYIDQCDALSVGSASLEGRACWGWGEVMIGYQSQRVFVGVLEEF